MDHAGRHWTDLGPRGPGLDQAEIAALPIEAAHGATADVCSAGVCSGTQQCAGYVVSGGSRPQFQGTYGQTSLVCNDLPVYCKGSDYCLYQPTDKDYWLINNEDSAAECADRGYISIRNCPGRHDDPAACVQWKENTGPEGSPWVVDGTFGAARSAGTVCPPASSECKAAGICNAETGQCSVETSCVVQTDIMY
eukprot:COSAG06_NODE_24135_length_671_cov_2.157343_1_plen_194_part_00